ncbi:MAG: hypothetical protein ABSD58_07040 [Verrucomicrobiia bacterium]|jgi:hypothetical protein
MTHDFDGTLGIRYGRQFQDRDKLLWLAIRPAVTAFGLWMADQVKDLDIGFPNGLAREIPHAPALIQRGLNRTRATELPVALPNNE